MLLAQANIALFRWALEDPRMHAFAAQIDSINQLAERSPGFVWRFAEEFDPTDRDAPFNDPLLFFNMSVWRDVNSLRVFVFQSEHTRMLERRALWTRPAGQFPNVLWWIEDHDQMPTVDDAIRRFAILSDHNETAAAFTFADIAPHPNE